MLVAVTVTDLVAVRSAQPPVPVIVYVRIAVPAANPVTTPDWLSTDAIAELLEAHVPPETLDENEVVAPAQTV